MFKFLNRPPKHPVIETPWGPVTESARKQAAENMRRDPSIRHRVEQKIIEECGGDVERGRAEFRRRYPEVFR